MSASTETTNSNLTQTGAHKKALWFLGIIAAIATIFTLAYWRNPEPIHRAADKCKEGFKKMGPQPDDTLASKKLLITGSIITTLASLALLHYWCRPEAWRKLFRKEGKEAPEPAKT